jgi:hypothetical protein
MTFRVEFDPKNRILLRRIEGPLTEESLEPIYLAGEKYWAALTPRAEIVDFSCVTEVSISTERIRQLARQQPALPEMTNLPRIAVAPTTADFGLARMFQIVGENKRPLLQVVHTIEEAFAILGIQSPHFELLE